MAGSIRPGTTNIYSCVRVACHHARLPKISIVGCTTLAMGIWRALRGEKKIELDNRENKIFFLRWEEQTAAIFGSIFRHFFRPFAI